MFLCCPSSKQYSKKTFISSSEARSFTKPRWPLVHVTSFVPLLALIWLWFLFLPLPTFPKCQAVTWNCMQGLGALEQAPRISKIFIPPNSPITCPMIVLFPFPVEVWPVIHLILSLLIYRNACTSNCSLVCSVVCNWRITCLLLSDLLNKSLVKYSVVQDNWEAGESS